MKLTVVMVSIKIHQNMEKKLGVTMLPLMLYPRYYANLPKIVTFGPFLINYTHKI